MIASNGDSCTILIILLLSVFTHDFGVGNLTASIDGNIIEVDDIKSSSSLGTLAERSFLHCSNALTQTPELIEK